MDFDWLKPGQFRHIVIGVILFLAYDALYFIWPNSWEFLDALGLFVSFILLFVIVGFGVQYKLTNRQIYSSIVLIVFTLAVIRGSLVFILIGDTNESVLLFMLSLLSIISSLIWTFVFIRVIKYFDKKNLEQLHSEG